MVGTVRLCGGGWTFPLVYVTDDGVWDGVEGGGKFSEKNSEVSEERDGHPAG